MNVAAEPSLPPYRSNEPAGAVGFGPIAIAVNSSDPGAAAWLTEFLTPWFTPTSQAPEWRVSVSSCRDKYVRLAEGRPFEAAVRPCFAFHQEALSLPAWRAGDRLIVEDAERSCFLSLAPFDVEVTGDPDTRRWRFTSMWVLVEIAATRLRRTALDLHAAAVEAHGGAVLIAGPKEAGKTTLSLHLLRSGLCRWMANDRVLVSSADGSLSVRGVPTAVKVRPESLAEFPELCRGLSHVTRPYLYTLTELAQLTGGERSRESVPFALTPAQFMRRLRIESIVSAPLRAIVFPQIRPGAEGWTAERLDSRTVRADIWKNLYGVRSGPCEPTLFEQLDGCAASPSPDLAGELSERVPAYRVVFGPTACFEPAFASRLLAILES